MATSADWQKNTFYGTDAILPRFTHKFGKNIKPKFGSWIMGLAAKDAKIAKNM